MPISRHTISLRAAGATGSRRKPSAATCLPTIRSCIATPALASTCRSRPMRRHRAARPAADQGPPAAAANSAFWSGDSRAGGPGERRTVEPRELIGIVMMNPVPRRRPIHAAGLRSRPAVPPQEPAQGSASAAPRPRPLPAVAPASGPSVRSRRPSKPACRRRQRIKPLRLVNRARVTSTRHWCQGPGGGLPWRGCPADPLLPR